MSSLNDSPEEETVGPQERLLCIGCKFFDVKHDSCLFWDKFNYACGLYTPYHQPNGEKIIE